MSELSNTSSRVETGALIDTHCHLDDPAFDADRAAVISASLVAGVVAWINVGFNPSRWRSTIDLSRSTHGMGHALGMHPQDAEEWSPSTKGELRSLLRSSGALAVGEVGLDYARGTHNRDLQRRAFVEQLEMSLELGMGVIIHQRAAEDDLVEVLQQIPNHHPILLHSFDGKERLTALAKQRHYLVGVGGLATRPRNGALRERLSTLPLTQVVLESDAPYLVPHGVGGKRNVPANVQNLAAFLTHLHSVPSDHLAAVTSANATKFFGQQLLINAQQSV